MEAWERVSCIRPSGCLSVRWKHQPENQVDQDSGKGSRNNREQNVSDTRTGHGPAKMLRNAGTDTADHRIAS